jgi:hypothetical protein
MDPVSIIVQIVIAVVMMAISYAITASMARRAPAKKPNALEDFDFPQDAEGTPQAVIFGDVWTKDWTVLWYGDFVVTPIRKKGGKK